MPAADFGVLAVGYSLGEPRDVAENAARYGLAPDQARQWGFETYHEAAPGDTTPTFGARAGRAALARAGLSPQDIDLLVVTSATVPEYFNWDLSAAVARELGLRSTPTLLLVQGCASAVLGFAQVAGVLATRPQVHTVLYVSSDRVSEVHTRRLGGPTADSDGAVALVLRRDHPGMRWLATEEIRDSEYANFFRLEYGGSAVPEAPAGRSNVTTNPATQVYRYFRDDPAAFEDFARMCDDRLVEAVDGACRQAGMKRAELSRAVLLHDNQQSLRATAAGLGLDLQRTNAGLAARLGHFGGLDPLLSLALHHDRGELTAGEVVALAGMSSGLCWFCTLIEV